MTDAEILQKAIEKAKVNGWEYYDFLTYETKCGEVFVRHLEGDLSTADCAYQVIFSHDFAKAFWGEEQITWDCEYCDIPNSSYLGKGPAWKIYLQKMVLEENPVWYLAKFL